MLSHISFYLHIRDISLQYVTAQKELNCCTLEIQHALHIVLSVGDTASDYPAYVSKLRMLFPMENHVMFLFKSNVYRPPGTSLLKALFLI